MVEMTKERRSGSRRSSSRSGSSPGTKVRPGEGLRPGLQGRHRARRRTAGELLQDGHRAARRVPGAAGRRRTRTGVLVVPAGDGRGRQGRDDPPRHERREPAGRARSAASRSRRPRSSTTTTCGATPGGCPARGEIGIFNRSHYEEVLVVRVHPEILDRQKLPERGQGRRHLGRAATGRSTTGSATSPTTGSAVVKLFLNLSKEEQRTRFLKRIDVPGAELEVLRRRRPRAAALGRLPGRVLRDAVGTPAPSGRRGTSSRPTASGSPASAPAAVLAHTLIEIDPQYPDGRRGRPCATAEVARQELEAEAPEGAAPDPFAAAHDGHGARPSARATAGRRHAATAARPRRGRERRDRRPAVDTQHAPRGPPGSTRGTRARPPTSPGRSASTPTSG